LRECAIHAKNDSNAKDTTRKRKKLGRRNLKIKKRSKRNKLQGKERSQRKTRRG